jgi:hypothetical protein
MTTSTGLGRAADVGEPTPAKPASAPECETSWMPPCLEIYGLTRSRNSSTIERFLDAYAPRARELGDVEVMLYDEAAVNDTFRSAWERPERPAPLAETDFDDTKHARVVRP